MIRACLKTLGFAALVLLLGQIHIGHDTVGAHFQKGVLNSLAWSGKEIRRSGVIDSLGGLPVIGDWFKASSQPLKESPKSRRRAEMVLPEDISPSDRESLHRLLVEEPHG